MLNSGKFGVFAANRDIGRDRVRGSQLGRRIERLAGITFPGKGSPVLGSMKFTHLREDGFAWQTGLLVGNRPVPALSSARLPFSCAARRIHARRSGCAPLSEGFVIEEPECAVPSVVTVFGIRTGPPTAVPKLFWTRGAFARPVLFRKKSFASNSRLRRNSKTLPCSALEPDFIVVLITAALRPNSAPKVERWMLNSSIASMLGRTPASAESRISRLDSVQQEAVVGFASARDRKSRVGATGPRCRGRVRRDSK